MKEKYQKVIKIQGITKDAMEEILNFIYCGKIELNDSNVLNVLEAASIMQVLGIIEFLEKYLVRGVPRIFEKGRMRAINMLSGKICSSL